MRFLQTRTGTTELFDGLLQAARCRSYGTGQFLRATLRSQPPNFNWGATNTIKRLQVACLLGGSNWAFPRMHTTRMR
jgi:hypothetical protein